MPTDPYRDYVGICMSRSRNARIYGGAVQNVSFDALPFGMSRLRIPRRRIENGYNQIGLNVKNINVFDKSGAEPNKGRAMPGEEKVHGYEQFNEAKRAFVFTFSPAQDGVM